MRQPAYRPEAWSRQGRGGGGGSNQADRGGNDDTPPGRKAKKQRRVRVRVRRAYASSRAPATAVHVSASSMYSRPPVSWMSGTRVPRVNSETIFPTSPRSGSWLPTASAKKTAAAPNSWHVSSWRTRPSAPPHAAMTLLRCRAAVTHCAFVVPAATPSMWKPGAMPNSIHRSLASATKLVVVGVVVCVVVGVDVGEVVLVLVEVVVVELVLVVVVELVDVDVEVDDDVIVLVEVLVVVVDEVLVVVVDEVVDEVLLLLLVDVDVVAVVVAVDVGVVRRHPANVVSAKAAYLLAARARTRDTRHGGFPAEISTPLCAVQRQHRSPATATTRARQQEQQQEQQQQQQQQ